MFCHRLHIFRWHQESRPPIPHLLRDSPYCCRHHWFATGESFQYCVWKVVIVGCMDVEVSSLIVACNRC